MPAKFTFNVNFAGKIYIKCKFCRHYDSSILLLYLLFLFISISPLFQVLIIITAIFIILSFVTFITLLLKVPILAFAGFGKLSGTRYAVFEKEFVVEKIVKK